MPLMALRCRYIKLIGRPFKRNRLIHNKKLRMYLYLLHVTSLKKKKLLYFFFLSTVPCFFTFFDGVYIYNARYRTSEIGLILMFWHIIRIELDGWLVFWKDLQFNFFYKIFQIYFLTPSFIEVKLEFLKGFLETLLRTHSGQKFKFFFVTDTLFDLS